jgi:hypothetical protein
MNLSWGAKQKIIFRIILADGKSLEFIGVYLGLELSKLVCSCIRRVHGLWIHTKSYVDVSNSSFSK